MSTENLFKQDKEYAEEDKATHSNLTIKSDHSTLFIRNTKEQDDKFNKGFDDIFFYLKSKTQLEVSL
jgi:hypothetical protein